MHSDALQLATTHRLEMRLNGPGFGSLTIRDGKASIDTYQEKLLYKMHIQTMKQRKQSEIEAIRKSKAIEYLQEKD